MTISLANFFDEWSIELGKLYFDQGQEWAKDAQEELARIQKLWWAA